MTTVCCPALGQAAAAAHRHMMEAMSKGVRPRAALLCSSAVSTRSTRAHSGRRTRPCCARMPRSLSASMRWMYARHATSAPIAAHVRGKTKLSARSQFLTLGRSTLLNSHASRQHHKAAKPPGEAHSKPKSRLVTGHMGCTPKMEIVLTHGCAGLRPVHPLERDVREGVRQSVAMVDGHQLPRAVRPFPHQDVAL